MSNTGFSHAIVKFKWAGFIGAALALSGCGALPNNGPVASEVIAAAANKGASSVVKPNYIFDVIDITPSNAETATQFTPNVFGKTFGIGKGGSSPLIGVGDTLQITIFEAGPDGIFSTIDKKSTAFNVTVQPDGLAGIPYIGSVKFANMTIAGVRASIVGRLKSKAVEPDVIISMVENGSRTVSVNGDVGKPAVVPLGLNQERVLDILAKAGGPKGAPYETSVTMTRGGQTGSISLRTLIEKASENVTVRAGDQFYVAREPQAFTVLGSTTKSAKITIDSDNLNLVEAIALAGGSNNNLSDPKNFFVFRYEYQEAIKAIVGEQRFDELVAAGIRSNERGQYPLVYRVDMRQPENYLVGQSFRIRNKDVIYLSRHPAADLVKFLQIVQSGAAVAGTFD